MAWTQEMQYQVVWTDKDDKEWTQGEPMSEDVALERAAVKRGELGVFTVRIIERQVIDGEHKAWRKFGTAY